MQKSFKVSSASISLQNFVVDNQNIQLKKPHRLLFSLFWLFFRNYFTAGKVRLRNVSLARSRSEFACSPAKIWLPICFKIQRLFYLYSTGFHLYSTIVLFIFNGVSIYIQRLSCLYSTTNFLLNVCSIFIQRAILFHST